MNIFARLYLFSDLIRMCTMVWQIKYNLLNQELINMNWFIFNFLYFGGMWKKNEMIGNSSKWNRCIFRWRKITSVELEWKKIICVSIRFTVYIGINIYCVRDMKWMDLKHSLKTMNFTSDLWNIGNIFKYSLEEQTMKKYHGHDIMDNMVNNFELWRM